MRTERAAAPGRLVARAPRRPGARSSRIAPREGERRLCSAITFTRPGRASAAANGRTAGRRPHRGVRGRRAAAAPCSAATRSRVRARIASRTEPGRSREGLPHPVEEARAPARRRSRPPPGATPSRRSFARPATTSAAAAFRRTTSRFGPGAPDSTSRAMAAFACGSPPRSASRGAGRAPRPPASTVKVRTLAAVELGHRRWGRRASARRGRCRGRPRPASSPAAAGSARRTARARPSARRPPGPRAGRGS